MLSRFGCLLSRFPAAPTQRLALQSARTLSVSTSLQNQASTKPVASNERRGLTGFLYEKTGVTGAWTLGVGIGAYLLSKELYVINSETVVMVVMGGVIVWLMKKIGKPVAEFLDNRSEGILNLLNEGKNVKISSLEEAIATEERAAAVLDSKDVVYEVLQENNAMRLEEEYRRRTHQVTSEVKKRLDYQVEMEGLQRKHEQELLIQWLVSTVTEAVKSKQDESLAQCMKDLKKMGVAV